VTELRILTAVTGSAWEAALVSALERAACGVSVVRRCVDVADLVSAAATGQARAALVSADLRRLDREALARLSSARVVAVGVVSPGDEDSERHLRQLGVNHIVTADAPATDVAAVVRRAINDQPSNSHVIDRAFADPTAMSDELTRLGPVPSWSSDNTVPAVPAELSGGGSIVAVWGPTGAPGRTTMAVTLAAELAALGRTTLLADADTYGGVIAQVLGVLDESPGLAAATRAANTGQLDLPTLARHARQIQPTLRVLTGIARADRWPELRPAALEVVWSLCRSLVDVTVVDTGFCIEQDEELSFDTAAPRRNGATLFTLDVADTVIVVGSADPVGIQRLVRGLTDLREAVPDARVVVAVNRLRRGLFGTTGKDAEHQIRQALDRYTGVRDCVFIPYDRAACDKALAAGRTLGEVAADSPARKAIAEIAAGFDTPQPVRRFARGRTRVKAQR
jgi:MinD-like ATPase involved in chromosome partitioning or flagellar assembly